MTRLSAFAELKAALDRGDHEAVLSGSEAILAERPGDDATHELRARALLALGRIDEAEREAQDAVRLDPDEIRYRELLAEILARGGAHRDAAAEFGRLARNDPRQGEWTVAEAQERLLGDQPQMSVEAARRAVRLDPDDPRAQLTLSRGLARVGDAAGALYAATAAVRLLPGDPAAREALADAEWLAGEVGSAFATFARLAVELSSADRARVSEKARRLARRHAGPLVRLVAAVPPLFRVLLRTGWLRVQG